jgi:hypothetical protein
MTQEELIYNATVAFDKGYDFVKMKYSDYMYGKEGYMEDVWEYVIEIKKIGMLAFKEKYKGFNTYF